MRNNTEKAYGRIMESLQKEVMRVLKEEFKAPEKTLKEKLFGLSKQYDARVAKAENEYYTEHREKFVNALKKAATLEDLLRISRGMMADGFKFPISGMVAAGVAPARAGLGDIIWQSYDLDTSFRANELASIEKKTGVNDVVVYTYYYSWKWWVANIIRCLFFWKEPYGKEADEKVGELLKQYSPKCPIIAVYPDYFKQN